MSGATSSRESGSGTRVTLETFPEYVSKLLQVVPDFPEKVNEHIKNTLTRYGKDSVFWAPEMIGKKRCDFKQDVHSYIMTYATNVFNMDVKKYQIENNCSKHTAEEEVLHEFGNVYSWHNKYIDFGSKYC